MSCWDCDMTGHLLSMYGVLLRDILLFTSILWYQKQEIVFGSAIE